MNKSEILLELENVKKMLKIADARIGRIKVDDADNKVEQIESRSWLKSGFDKLDKITKSLQAEVGSISEK